MYRNRASVKMKMMNLITMIKLLRLRKSLGPWGVKVLIFNIDLVTQESGLSEVMLRRNAMVIMTMRMRLTKCLMKLKKKIKNIIITRKAHY